MEESLPIELILIILLGLLVVLLVGVALRMASTLHKMKDYIGELERDNRNAKDEIARSKKMRK